MQQCRRHRLECAKVAGFVRPVYFYRVPLCSTDYLSHSSEHRLSAITSRRCPRTCGLLYLEPAQCAGCLSRSVCICRTHSTLSFRVCDCMCWELPHCLVCLPVAIAKHALFNIHWQRARLHWRCDASCVRGAGLEDTIMAWKHLLLLHITACACPSMPVLCGRCSKLVRMYVTAQYCNQVCQAIWQRLFPACMDMHVSQWWQLLC